MTDEERNLKIEEIRNKRKKKIKITIAVIAAVVVLVGVIAYAVPTLQEKKRNNIKITATDGLVTNLVKDQKNLLFRAADVEFRQNVSLEKYNICLSRDKVFSYSNDGSIINSISTGYSSPILRTSGENFIVYERSTGKYKICDKNSVIVSNQFENEIINCALSEKNNFVVAMRKTQTTETVSVYKIGTEQKIFSWECTDRYITDIAISPDGKNIAVAVFVVKDGVTNSSVIYFKTDSKDIENEMMLSDSMIYNIHFNENKKIGILTDKGYISAEIYGDKKTESLFDYDKVVSFKYADNGSIAVKKSLFGTLDNYGITVIDNKGKEVRTFKFKQEISDFDLVSGKLYVLLSGKVKIFDLKTGEQLKKIDVTGGLEKIAVSGSDIFCSNSEFVYCYN